MAQEIKSKLKLGIIGMSKGNGHPYSWAAICNGYRPEYMKDCPFAGIPAYLEKEKWPEAQIKDVVVSHIWTQEKSVSKHIADASKIEHIVEQAEDMIGQVDAILLARDDAENHLKMAMPFLQAGLPIFIDKPLALSLKDAETMLLAQQYPTQLFSCSSLRYAEELKLSDFEQASIGSVVWIEATVAKNWETYAIHLLEPIVAQIGDRGAFETLKKVDLEGVQFTLIKWSNLVAYLRVTGEITSPIQFTFHGKKGQITKTFKDSFACFKQSILTFIEGIKSKSLPISREETLELVQIIEAGTI